MCSFFIRDYKCKVERAAWNLEVTLRLMARFYMINYVWIMCMIVTCSWSTFAIHWSQVGARLGIDITLLLVCVAFKQDMNTVTPDIAYLTMLDTYTIAGITFLVALVVCHAIMGFSMFDCDILTGDCTFGVYWPWHRYGVRDIDGKIGLDGNMPVQDDHMQIGYTVDFALTTIYICCWVGYNLLWWRKQRLMVKHNSNMLQNDDPQQNTLF